MVTDYVCVVCWVYAYACVCAYERVYVCMQSIRSQVSGKVTQCEWSSSVVKVQRFQCAGECSHNAKKGACHSSLLLSHFLSFNLWGLHSHTPTQGEK